MNQTEPNQQSEGEDSNIQQNKGQFRQQLLYQYYRYLNLLKKTNNFCKDFNVYKNINDHDFENLALLGWIFQVTNLKLKTQNGTEQPCLVPTIYSNIKDPFKNYQQSNPLKSMTTQLHQTPKRIQPQRPFHSLSSSTNTNDQLKSLSQYQGIKRSMILIKSLYTKHFIKAFNQIIKQSNQFKKTLLSNNQNNNSSSNHVAEIQWIYCFTGLKLSLNQDKIYFALTQKTKIIALQSKFYMQVLENMQKSIGFPYSYLSLNISPQNYAPESIQQGYSLTTLQTQASIIQKISFTGLLKQVYIQQPSSNKQTPHKKDKQIILRFLQDGFHPSKQMIGLAKVVIKLGFQQNQQQLLDYFKIGFIYLVTNVSLYISDTINVIYRLKNKWQQHIFQINLQKPVDIGVGVLEELPCIDLACLKLATVNRNIIKVKVDLVRCEHFFGKVTCTQCHRAVNSDQYCTGYCGKNPGQLNLWTIVLVSDQSSYAELSLETNQTLQYFDFNQQHISEIKKFILQQNSKKMVKVFNLYTYYSNRSSSEPILSFQKHLAARFITKTLICVPKFNVNESFNQQLSQQQKIQFQQSLQTSKQYMKKNKVYFNGYVKRIQKNVRKSIAFLKVIKILN